MVWQVHVVVKEGDLRQRICGVSAATERRRCGGGVDENRARLYALRRRFVAVVDASGIAVKVLGSARAWWSSAHPQRVDVKKRLVKITDERKRVVMIRLATKEAALEFAAAVSESGAVDPLVHGAEPRDTEREDQKQLEDMAALFMSSPAFRAQIQQLHGHLEELWSV